MKSNKSNTRKVSPLLLSLEEREAITHALDFMAHYRSYTYDESKFSSNDVFTAAEKIDNNESTFTRCEIRAISTSIEFALQSLLDDAPALAQVAEVFPDLILDLRNSKTLLESVRTRLAAYTAKLSRKK